MNKIADIKTKKPIKEINVQQLSQDWTVFSEKHFDENAIAIYYDERKNGVYFISPDVDTLVKMVVGAYITLLKNKVIRKQSLLERFKNWLKN